METPHPSTGCVAIQPILCEPVSLLATPGDSGPVSMETANPSTGHAAIQPVLRDPVSLSDTTLPATSSLSSIKEKTLADFFLSSSEHLAQLELNEELNAYMLQVLATEKGDTETPFLNLQDYFGLTRITHTERSHVVYLEVMDAVEDTKDTVMQLLHDFRREFVDEKGMEWLVVDGDARFMKSYRH